MVDRINFIYYNIPNIKLWRAGFINIVIKNLKTNCNLNLEPVNDDASNALGDMKLQNNEDQW